MYNLYDNSFLKEDSQKKYISIPLEQMNKSHPQLFLILNKFLKSLIDYPDILYKIIKCSNEKDLSNSFLLFITNNLFNDILSPEIIPQKLLIIIEKLLYEEIKNISNKKDLISFITNSKISKLFFGFKYYDEVQIYFNLLIGDIIENYENSGMNTIPLIFKINKLSEYIRIKEEILNQELNSEKEFKREEAKRKKSDENFTLTNIYKMKVKCDDSTSYSLSGLFSFEEEEDLNNEMNNSEIFMAKYAPELNKKELNEIINKYSDNEYIQYYLKNQLRLLEKDDNLLGNTLFFEHIQVLKESEKLLYYYQRNFNIVREILLKIYQNYKKTTHLIPYSIKCISRIIFNLIKLKFPELKRIEINNYIKILFFNIIFEQFILSSDYSTLMSTTIISKETKHNLKVIFAIWKKFIYGTFYTNDIEEYSDYTPFNWFFIDIIEEDIGFSEKIIDVNIPEYLLRININEDNNNLKNLEILENKNKLFYSYSSCFTIDNILTLIKIIKSNEELFFQDKENPINDELKNSIMNIKINENILVNIKDKENCKNTNYYIYYEIFYENSNIFYENQQLAVNNQKLEENDEIFIENIKKNLSNLLFNTDLTIIKNNKNINLNNLKQILKELNKNLKIESYLSGNNYEDDNIESECYINTVTNINVIQELNIQNKLNINSLIILFDNIHEKYKENNYKLFFDSFFDEISSSINNYDFELLSPFLDKLKNIKKNKNIYLINQEKYKHIFIHSKLRNFIDNEQIEVEIKFKYNENEKYFSISKKEKTYKKLNDKKDTVIICHTIPDFFRKFPNLSKLQLKKEVDLLNLKYELNIKSSLLDYFHIVKEHLVTKFNKQEIKIVYPKIKKRIFVKLYNKIFPKEADDDDLTFHYKCLCLSWIQPKHLNNQIYIYNDNFINIISNLFNQMNIEKSYSGKLEIIEKIFNIINNILKINKGDNYSTDDIAPICEYALIKAKPERLSSNLKFIEIMMSENSSNLSKMHFDSLKTHMITIKNCNYNHFYGIEEEEYNQNCLKAKNEAFETNS